MRCIFATLAVLALLGCNRGGEKKGNVSSSSAFPSAQTIVVGIDPTTPPFESLDLRTNQPVGFDVDVMNAVGRLIGAKVEYRIADFKTIFEELNAGQFDAVISAATITEDRKRMVAFSDPYVDIAQIVVVRKGTTRIGGVQDLKRRGILVGVQTGTTGEHVLLANAMVEDKNLRRYDNVALALADLANGSIDAVVDDQPILLNFLSQPGFRNQLMLVGPLSRTESYGIAIKKKDVALLQAINTALKRLRAEGVLDRLSGDYHLR